MEADMIDSKIVLTHKSKRLEIDVRLVSEVKKSKLNIHLRPVKNIWVFSAVGILFENGKDVAGGQCLTRLSDMLEHLPPRKRKAAEEFLGIWDRWHLNDLRLGTVKQDAAIRGWLEEGWEYNFDSACEKLKEAGLYEDRGYVYGSKWLYEALPDGFQDRANKLIDIMNGG
jgi:hypothetical protein